MYEVITRTTSTPRDDKKLYIKTKFDSECAACPGMISAGTICLYMPEVKSVWHVECGDKPRKGRIGYSSRASRGATLNGGAGGKNKKIRRK